MKLVPLQQWICDSCGDIIEGAENGWIEWRDDFPEDSKSYGFRIVHHRRECQTRNRSNLRDLPLDSVTGPNGLVHLLAILTPGKANDPESKYGAKDLDEWIELVRRLHTPHYEEARRYWEAALDDGFGADTNEYWLYLQENLRIIINRYGPDME